MYMDKVTGKFNSRQYVPGTIAVPCGRCIQCRIQRSKTWALRLMAELKYWEVATFLTLTYDEDHLPEGGGLQKEDVQKYFRRLRKDIGSHEPIKHFSVGEYGEKGGRPHYHSIVFGLSPDRVELNDNWRLGNHYVGTVTYDSCRYVTDYVTKKLYGKMAEEVYGGKEAPFLLLSKGIGKRFALDNADSLKNNLIINARGTKHVLPRYYRELLDISSDEYLKKALEVQREQMDEYRARGLDNLEDMRLATIDAGEQSELNVIARRAVRSKYKL